MSELKDMLWKSLQLNKKRYGKMTKTKQNWKDIKPVLADFSSKQLLALAQDLYNFNPENKAFFHARFLKTNAGLADLASYKERIEYYICPVEPWDRDYSLREGRKVLSEFKKANGNLKDTLELMLYYVRCGNSFTLEFGDIDEAFYNSMESMFYDLVKKLIKEKDEKLAAEFLPQMEAEFQRVDDQVGWGYPDGLRDCLSELYEAFPAPSEQYEKKVG